MDTHPPYVQERVGDLFKSPADSVLIHACNCMGRWGAGIAAQFKQLYPAAYKVYESHCREHKANPRQLLGTCLLIPPQPQDVQAGRSHYVACLFTSARYGAKKDKPDDIIRATGAACEDLKEQVGRLWNDVSQWHGRAEPIFYACKINSGRFGVDWEDTRKALEAREFGVTVLEPGNGS